MNEIYAIYDSKAKYYMPFFAERNHATAIRAVESAISDQAHQLYRHASDYQLFHLGSWDPITGKLNPTGPTHVADVWVLKAQMEGTN